MTKLTQNTITKEKKLRDNLNGIRKRGYSIDDEENQPDVYCLGFSIVKEERIYGAFSISIPKYRVKHDKIGEIVAQAKTMQQRIVAEI